MSNMAPDQFQMNAGGDILEVQYDGTMWQAPSTGSQHTGRNAAMRVEIREYLLASDDPDCPEDAGDIDLGRFGHWLTPEG